MNIGARRAFFTLELNLVSTDQIALVIGPTDTRLNAVIIALVNPIADHPLELLQTFIW